jgi:hypothetical protein
MTEKESLKKRIKKDAFRELYSDDIKRLGTPDEITLLDRFAGIALSQLLFEEACEKRILAAQCYEIAGAMINERDRILSQIRRECRIEADRQVEEQFADGEDNEV